jgi:hypothetical protein
LEFQTLFPKILKNTKRVFAYSHQVWVSFRLREGSFRLQLNINMNENLKIFVIKFPKFNNLYATFFRKKRKIVEIQKEHKKTDRIFLYNLSIYLAYINFYFSIQK